MSNYTTKDKLGLYAHKGELEMEIQEAWESGDPDRINQARKVVMFWGKLTGDLRKAFDDNFDDKAVMGSDFAQNVERIRVKSDKVGRPTKVKVDPFADLK